MKRLPSRRSLPALLTAALLLAAGGSCSTPEIARGQAAAGHPEMTTMTVAELKPLLKEALAKVTFYSRAEPKTRSMEFGHNHIVLKWVYNGAPKTAAFAFADASQLAVLGDSNTTYVARELSTDWTTMPTWEHNEEAARQYLGAMNALAVAIPREDHAAEASLGNFEQVVNDYHRGSMALSDEVRHLRGVAQKALKDHDYDKALESYEKGLTLEPGWPEGHYHRGLLLERTGFTAQAIVELKKYLLLEPEGSSARAAREKLKSWTK